MGHGPWTRLDNQRRWRGVLGVLTEHNWPCWADDDVSTGVTSAAPAAAAEREGARLQRAGVGPREQ